MNSSPTSMAHPEETPFSTAAERLAAEMRACRRCLDAGHAITPGAVFSGNMAARVMLIGQAPGITEVQAKRPFNAGSGRRLFQWLGEAGWEEDDFRARQYMTAVTKCYPGKGKNGKGDRLPSKAEQALCRPFLEREITLVNPRLIIPVGGLAIKLFYPAKLRLDEAIGTALYFPPQALSNPLNFDFRQAEWLKPHATGRYTSIVTHRSRDGRFVVPLPHPSGASLWPNKPQNKLLIGRALEILGDIRVRWVGLNQS